MKISSPAFENNQKIPLGFSCDGKGDNPPLTFEDVPEDAKSLVLIVEDPDAPGQTFDHWVVYNIDPKTTKVEVRQKPDNGIEGLTSAGSNSFVPPCPPTGSHRYFFKLYALDAMLNLPTGVGKRQVEQAMQGHIVDQAQLVGLYSRGG